MLMTKIQPFLLEVLRSGFINGEILLRLRNPEGVWAQPPAPKAVVGP